MLPIAVIGGLLLLPAVQTFIAQKVTRYLNDSYNININIEKIHIKPWLFVDIKGVLIADHKGDTLIAAQKLNTSILSLKQLTERKYRRRQAHFQYENS